MKTVIRKVEITCSKSLKFKPGSLLSETACIFVKHQLHLLNHPLKNSHNNVTQKHFVYNCSKWLLFAFTLGQCSLMFPAGDILTHTIICTHPLTLIKTATTRLQIICTIFYRLLKEIWSKCIIQDIRNVTSKQPWDCLWIESIKQFTDHKDILLKVNYNFCEVIKRCSEGLPNARAVFFPLIKTPDPFLLPHSLPSSFPPFQTSPSTFYKYYLFTHCQTWQLSLYHAAVSMSVSNKKSALQSAVRFATM